MGKNQCFFVERNSECNTCIIFRKIYCCFFLLINILFSRENCSRKFWGYVTPNSINVRCIEN